MAARMSFNGFKSASAHSLLAVILPIVMIACFGGGWILAASADSLSAGDARALLQRIFGADFKKNQVQIKKISSGIGGGALVDARIETTFRFAREGRDWKAVEMRVGDRQWESLELVDEAVRREKTRRTTAVLEKIAASLAAYHRVSGRYVVADEFMKLLDELAPRYFGPIVYFDHWGTPLTYRGTETGYRLASAGPDRAPDTSDDLVLENGVIKPVSVAQNR
ncbi:MAG: hypothetical protein ABI882_22380 [Acidobacteriota bacterium]